MNHARTEQQFPLAPARRQRGASLLEVIAYLGIAAIVVLGAVSLLGTAFGNAQSNRLTEEVVSIRTGVKRLFMAQPGNYGTAGDDLTLQAERAGIIPATLTRTGTGPASTITNAWGGAVTIASTGTGFAITYTQVPREACVSSLSGASGWTAVKGNNPEIRGTPVSPANANTTCGEGPNTVVWTAS